MPRWARLALAFASGAAMPWAFAPTSLRGLGWLALGLFAWLLIEHREKSIWLGLAFGLGWFGVGAWWLAPVFETYGHLSPLAAWLAEAAVGLVLALHPALWATVVAWFRAPVARALAFVGLGVLIEWLRGHWMSGLPWTTIGTLALDTPWQDWIVALGAYGAACFVLLGASCIGLGLFIVHHSQWRWLKKAFVLFATLALFGIFAPKPAAFGQDRIQALLVQPNVPQEQKWQASFFGEVLRRLNELSQSQKADLIVWPEAAIPAVLSDSEKLLFWILERSQRLKTPILLGAVVRTSSGQLQNGALAVADHLRGFTGKRHLVPFGEYVPFWAQGWLPRLVPEIGRFLPDSDPKPLRIKGISYGVLICYESIFPEEARLRVQNGAEVLVVLTNDAWYGQSPAAWQHMEAARLRALELGRFVLHATNTGITAAIAPDGRIEKALPWWTKGALLASFAPMRVETPYLIWGDWPALLTAATLVLLAWGRVE